MRTFTMYRRNVPTETHDENQRNAPGEPQFEGVVFSDGRVAIRWMTAKRSTSAWDSMDDMLAIHGHPEYDSELVWDRAVDADTPDEPRPGLCSECELYLDVFRTCSVGPAETCDRSWPNARCYLKPPKFLPKYAADQQEGENG